MRRQWEEVAEEEEARERELGWRQGMIGRDEEGGDNKWNRPSGGVRSKRKEKK